MRLVNTLTAPRLLHPLHANTSITFGNAFLAIRARVIRAKPIPMIILYWLIKTISVITIISKATDI
jgi:hypothetical protein